MERNKIFYVTDCGIFGLCTHGKKDLKKKRTITKEGKISYVDSCSEHGGRIVERKTKCLDCDKTIHVGTTGKVPVRCEKHTRRYHINVCKEYQQNKSRKRIKHGKSCCKFLKTLCGGFCVMPYFKCKPGMKAGDV